MCAASAITKMSVGISTGPVPVAPSPSLSGDCRRYHAAAMKQMYKQPRQNAAILSIQSIYSEFLPFVPAVPSPKSSYFRARMNHSKSLDYPILAAARRAAGADNCACRARRPCTKAATIHRRRAARRRDCGLSRCREPHLALHFQRIRTILVFFPALPPSPYLARFRTRTRPRSGLFILFPASSCTIALNPDDQTLGTTTS